jgi:hypothetical protein
MTVTNVNREERLSKVLSVRLRERELKWILKTLRNYGIQGDSRSEQLRALFHRIYWSSVRWRRNMERAQRERERGKDY